jgi:hypothetical protein
MVQEMSSNNFSFRLVEFTLGSLFLVEPSVGYRNPQDQPDENPSNHQHLFATQHYR